jgi:EpsI family protein
MEPKMPLDRRNFLLGAAMCAASGIAIARQPQPDNPRITPERFEALVPKRFAGWRFHDASGIVLPPADALSEQIYNNLVTRTYIGPQGQAVMLLLAYSNVQDGTVQLHRPEVCYPAGGFTLSPVRRVEMADDRGHELPISLFSASSFDRNEQVLYWTRLGNDFPLSWAGQRLSVIRANIGGEIPDGLLGRVSMMAPDMADARPVLEQFLRELLAAMTPAGRALLLGRGR